MNHQYRVVWNASTRTLQAVAETAKSQGKGHSVATEAAASQSGAEPLHRLGFKTLSFAIASALLGLPPAAWAGPQGGTVTAGSATIRANGTATTINQSSNQAAIDWTSFSVGKSESVRFNQPNASSITLNRVTGTESSQILGNLSANGQVFVLNPNGLLVGKGAQITTGGFMASTLGMTNEDFMAGRYQLKAASGMAANASVSNAGSINVADGGSIVLIAPLVSNTGTLSAPHGSVLLAAANAVTLTLQDNQRLSYTLDQGSLQAMVDNGGLIQAAGGHVMLTAKGHDALTKATVNHSGIIEAQTVQEKGGVVELLADMQGGQVKLSGRIDASAPKGGNGGFVETSAATVDLSQPHHVTTLAPQGKTGTWLIDPNDYTIAASGGNTTGTQLSSDLASTEITIRTATQGTSGGNGDIFVNDTVNWSANKLTLSAERNIQINANLNGGAAGKLALEYGQGAVAAGNTADYFLNNGSSVSLPAGANFSTKLGSDGSTTQYTVITALGSAGSTTTTDLQGIKGGLTGNYALGANMDATATSGWNAGAGFTPLGNGTVQFDGNFAGLGHTIGKLSISRSSDQFVGLFDYSLGMVRDVGLPDANVVGGQYVGALVGFNVGTVRNSFSTGSVSGVYQIGGLVGNNSGTISNSYATANVSSTVSVTGGLVGYNGSTVTNSYATGSVSGVDFTGGLVGWNEFIISNSYATGSVSGGNLFFTGGLVGRNNGTVTNSYWDTITSGQSSSSGGTGLTTAQMQQASSFAAWDMANSGGSTNVWRIYEGQAAPLLRSFLKPLTLTAEYDGSQSSMGGIAAYTASATVNGSQLLGTGRLVLASNGTAGQKTASIGGYYSTQQGYDISAAPRTISGGSNAANDVNVDSPLSWTSGQLVLRAQSNININANLNGGAAGKLALEYGQGAVAAGNLSDYNVNNGSNVTLAAGQNFSTKLGSDGTAKAYTVITDLGLAGSTSKTDLQGINGELAGNYALGADIDASVTVGWNGGAGWTPLGTTSAFTGTLGGLGHRVSSLTCNPVNGHGGFIAENAGTVRDMGLVNVHVTLISQYYAGGLAGRNSGTISNSYSTGSVSGRIPVGGLVGDNVGSISNSYSTAEVSGMSYLGGLVGGNDGSIGNSYATGSVTGTSHVGGLVGYGFILGSITNSYSTGSVFGNTNVGGLVGRNEGTVTNSYWDTTTSGQSSSAGGSGLTTAQMQQASSFAGWDMANSGGSTKVWRIYEGQAAPLLRSFLKPLTLTAEYDGSQSGMGGIAAYTASATVNGSQVLGAGTLVLASNGTAGQKTASIGGYYSTQQGYDISAAPRTITGGSNAANDVNVDSPLSWTSGQLVLRAQSNIHINANLNGGTAGKLALEYGQGAVAAGNLSDYNVNNGSNVTLAAGQNFSTKLGSDGSTTAYTVITALGSAGSTTTTDLQGINGGLAGNYALGADIDASATAGWNGGAGWTPLGAFAIGNRFSGTFAGLGHRVSNLTTVNDYTVSSRDAGFFGDISGTVRDTGVVDIDATGPGVETFTGGLAGYSSGTISNSYATGHVSGTGYTGGLVGANVGTIRNSYSTVNVTSGGTALGYATGGLVGKNAINTISNSYATGAVTGTDAVGGLVGLSEGYSTSSVSTISNSYSTGSVFGNTNVGGLLGKKVSGTVTNSYWDTTTSGQSSSAGGGGLTTAQMKQASSFAGWDMTSSGGSTAVWRIYEGQAAPLLRSFLKPLTVTANSGSKTYDGTAEALSRSFSTTPDMGHVLGVFTNATTSKDVGTYGVAVNGLYSDQQGYDITAVGGTVTINPRPLTVSADAKSKTYGDANPALTYTVAADGVGTSRGLVNSDTLSGALSTTATNTSGITTPSNSYSIDASALANGNYVITANNGVLTINPRPLTVTADAKSKTYGDANPLLTYTLAADGVGTSRGLVNNDTLSGNLSTNATTTSSITTPGNSYTIDASALANGNYVIMANNGLLTINPRPLTVTADAKSKTYGDANPALTYSVAADGVGTSRGLANNDTLSGALSTTATNTSGITTSSNSYTIDASALANGNYVITADNGVLTINPRPLTVTADAKSKTYGDANPALTYMVGADGVGTSRGLANNDTLSGALSTTATNTSGITTSSNSYTIDASALANGNYVITANNGVLTINPRPITVNADSQSKVYGSSDPTLTWQLASGSALVGTDSLAGSLSRVAGENVQAGGYAINRGTLANGNYSITYNGNILNITPKAIVVYADQQYKVYGSDDPSLTWQLESGSTLEGNDSLVGALARVAGENVLPGGYAISQGTLSNGNYAISFNGNKLTINPKGITVNADAQTKVYGSADPALTWQLASGSSLVGNDSLLGNLSRAAGENVQPGGYAISQGTLSNGNYAISFNGNTLTINPKGITVNADALSKVYGNADPALTWQLVTGSSLVGNDSLLGNLSRAAGENVQPGGYAISQGTLSNGNYAISFNGNTLTINPKGITVNADAQSKVFGDTDPAPILFS